MDNAGASRAKETMGALSKEPAPLFGRPGASGMAVRLSVAILVVAGTFLWRSVNGPRNLAPLGRGDLVRIQLPDALGPIAAGEGAAWVVVGGLGPSESVDVLWRIDADTNKADLLPNTRGAESPAVGEGGVWLTCMGEDNPCGGPSVLKLDPETGRTLATTRLPGTPWDIATGLGAIWVATSRGLAKIDPSSARLVGTFHPPPRPQFDSVGTAGGALWATGTYAKAIYQIDPADGQVMRSIPQRDPCIVEASGDAVWVATCKAGLGRARDQLTKIDALSARVVFRTPLKGYSEIHAIGRALYLTRREPSPQWNIIQLVKLDPTSGRVLGVASSIRPGPIRYVETGHVGLGGPAVLFAGDGSSLWLTDFGSAEVIRLGL
jgi:hypothetical protein